MNSPDVIVIGIGAFGSAVSYHLARRGAKVLGLEQFDIPNTRGSSGGDTRLIRLSYFEHPDYVPLLRRAYANWDEIGERAQEQLLFRTGAVYIGRPEGELIDGSRRAAATHAIGYAMLSPQEVRDRCGPFRIPEGFVAMYEDVGGFVMSLRAIACHAEQARMLGADLHAGERVIEWTANSSGVEVLTDRDRYAADRLVITAGSWAPQLIASLPVALEVTRQPLVWVLPKEPERFTRGRFCCWAIEGDAPVFRGIHYGFPLLDGQTALKIGHHLPGEATTPDMLDRNPRPQDFAAVQPVFDEFLPAANGPQVDAMVCMYTNSPDGHFILDRYPGRENVIIACGFSGHGFKFASALGEALADLALDGASALPVEFLGLARFDPPAGDAPG